jgi:Chlorite dismutase
LNVPVDLDLREKGAVRNGARTASDSRLFMQLLAYGGCQDTAPVTRALAEAQIEGVVYEDFNDPRGVAVLIWNKDPEFFIATARPLFLSPPFAELVPKLEYTMVGRTYAIGHEPDLEAWLFEKPRRTALNPLWPWAIWYPLRRAGAFSGLAPEEMGRILSEHGKIGHSFGEADYAHDIRLACFGLDKNDNDFVIGLVGRELFPLSACVQAMRKTRQTSQYIQNMGPFFIGKAVWQSPLPDAP